MCDVLIVGEGVAGIGCALRLLQIGLRPTIISSGAEVPDGAEVIPEPVLPLLRQLGLMEALTNAGAEQSEGFENYLDAERPVLLPGSWTYFERKDFLRLALQEALSRGVRLERSRDLRNRAGHQDAAAVIDATGRSAILSQPVEQRGSDVATLFRIRGRATDRARVFRCGMHWIYAIPLAADTTVGVVGLPVDEIPQSVRATLHLNGPAVRIARRPAFAQRSTRPVNCNRLAIGDAAMAYNPLSGHGIRFAIQSGLAAAAVIRTWQHAPDDAAVATRYYEEFVMAAWRRHIAFLEGASSSEPRVKAAAVAGPIQFRASIRMTGIHRDARIVAEEAVQLADGGLVRWVGGVDLLQLRTLAAAPIAQPELIARLSVLGLTPDQALQLVEWCVDRGVLG